MQQKRLLGGFYNGGTESFYFSDDPTGKLVKGKYYAFASQEDINGYQTNITIRGIEGEFNSTWFDEKLYTKKTFLAKSHDLPTIGNPFRCSRWEESKNLWWAVKSSAVINYIPLSSNIFWIETTNSIYITEILPN